jgi:hypothetical protein
MPLGIVYTVDVDTAKFSVMVIQVLDENAKMSLLVVGGEPLNVFGEPNIHDVLIS